MERRRVLAALGASTVTLAGCLTGGEETDDGPDEDGDGRGEDQETDSTDPDAGTEPESVVASFEMAPTRPECDVASEPIACEGTDGEKQVYETAATVPYPEKPSSFTRDDLFAYIEAFDHAFRSRDALCRDSDAGYTIEFTYSVKDRGTFEWYEGIEILHLYRVAGPTRWLTVSDDVCAEAVATVIPTGVIYAIDETGLARVAYPGGSPGDPELEEGAPDPLAEGELVAAFDS